jgi:hypothetical protein
MEQADGGWNRKRQIPRRPSRDNRQECPSQYGEQTAPSFPEPGNDKPYEEAAEAQRIKLFPGCHLRERRKTFTGQKGEKEQDHQRPADPGDPTSGYRTLPCELCKCRHRNLRIG